MLVYDTSRHSVKMEKKDLNKGKYSVALRVSGAELIRHRDGLVLKVPVIATYSHAGARRKRLQPLFNRFAAKDA